MKDHHKMRAWDGEKYWHHKGKGNWYTEVVDHNDGKKLMAGQSWLWINENCKEIELCSGVPDKSGTLIYEKDYLSDGTKTLTVCFSNGYFFFEGKEDEQIIWEDIRRFYKKVGTVHEGTTEYLIKSQRRDPAKTTNL